MHQPSEGTYEVEGTPVSFDSPREALEPGIATVYQDLAVCPLRRCGATSSSATRCRRACGWTSPS
ncbi:MAG: hypothetical protein ACLPKE_19560 [Streptosporangiaceae bacterium]